MACTREHGTEIGELAGGRLDAARAEALLAHVETCAACSAELDLVADLLDSARALRLSEGLVRRRSLRPRVVAVLALAAAVVAWLFVLRPAAPERSLRTLAQLAPPPLAELVLRGQGGLQPGEEARLESVRAHFAARAYAAAAEDLGVLLEARPEDALTHFYLGVARLQLGQHELALAALRRVAEAGEGLLAEQALWYSAQAQLALEHGLEARALLQRLVDADGDYEPNARAQLALLEPLLGR